MKARKNPHAKFHTLYFGIIFLALTAIVVVALCAISQKKDLDETYALAQETESFLETTCKKYQNYDNGNAAKSLENLLDTATGLRDFISKDKLYDSRFLFRFIRAEHLGGVLLTDSAGNVVSQADMDDNDPIELWGNTLQTDSIKDILSHPSKTYSSTERINNIPYNFAVISYGDGLLLCYESTEKPTTDQYEFSFKDILTNDTFRKNPAALIAKDGQTVSSNSEILEGAILGKEGSSMPTIEWRNDGLAQFEYDGANWFGLRSVYENYDIYLVYPASEVFSSTTTIVSFGLIGYLALCSAILIVRGYLYKKNLRTTEKQLRIIKAISATYRSTFLFYLDNMELEPINISPKMAEVFEQYPEPQRFLTHICLESVAPEYREAVFELMNPSTLAARLKDVPFIACDVKDPEGTWFSLQVIPQKRNDKGELQTVLVATRNVTSLKQAEILSYHDKLTGLRNRNYLESHSEEFASRKNLPLSVIMADCNYLKRTNDEMGHTWGDTLLQRTAEALRETVRKTDTVMRIGGDEFLIVCPSTTAENAEKLVARMKQVLEEKSDEALTVSVSFGACTESNDVSSFEELCKRADAAMYEEKRAVHNATRR